MRWIDLHGAANVRDVGGLPAACGRSVAERRLVRADNLGDLAREDVATLVDGWQVRTVVDLRTPGEVDAEGPGALVDLPRVRRVHHSMLPEVGHATDASADALLTRRERLLKRYPDDIVCAMYLAYLSDRPDSVVGAFRALLADGGATLVHCAAGKDRTGVVVALALAAAGVRRDAIVADYIATGERIDAVLDRLRASPTYATDIDRIPVSAHTPRAGTMHAFLDELDRAYGGARGWLRQHGVSDGEVERLRAHLLEP
ncbi:tyrosine-protein phosphatase [Haloechinothrix sp. LS1_15]|uniref:tyrosine-protein phosphatase n=1 Tax=Haloechinothrix sp. LS1_15 TaxID=2652248 RepID=UPI002945EC8B|nr:tyrosine-protein phosphatase [Haloechinothrix sp. LS1_15]MDV6014221.1 tyrosine-protein phosphatase [Haloechinothrix sp. LS1_15]